MSVPTAADTPCMNSGTCTEGVNVYTCASAAGYEWDNWEMGTQSNTIIYKTRLSYMVSQRFRPSNNVSYN